MAVILKGSFWVLNCEAIGESDGMGSCVIRKKPNYNFAIPVKTTFCSVCRRLAGIQTKIAKLCAIVGPGDLKWYQSKC